MNVVLNEGVKDYMIEKEMPHIVVSAAVSHGWGGPISQVLARFASKEEESFLKGQGYKVVESELGKVYLDRKIYAYDDTITFNLSKFFWSTTLFVDGVGVEGGLSSSCR